MKNTHLRWSKRGGPKGLLTFKKELKICTKMLFREFRTQLRLSNLNIFRFLIRFKRIYSLFNKYNKSIYKEKSNGIKYVLIKLIK